VHILLFADQHPLTLGGAQVSMRLQRRFLERAGHTVSVVSPRRHGPAGRREGRTPGDVDLPSLPITVDLEYGMFWPGRRAERRVEAALRERPPVDVVHVQGDFWGAFLGLRYARRRQLPTVITMHNNVEAGIRAVAPLPGLVLRGLNGWQRRMLRTTARGPDGGAFLAGLAARADRVVAPSGHFARLLREAGVAEAAIVRTGVDDELVRGLASGPVQPRSPGELPRLVWLGRFSREKRPLELLEALALAGGRARLEMFGQGLLWRRAQQLARERGLGERVVFRGNVPHPEALAAIASADALVQTSVGFETQGMTVFEALALGTPVVLSDERIGAELGAGWGWQARDASVPALAAALRQAEADIAAGAAPVIGMQERAGQLQSAQTARMLAIYEELLASRGHR